MSSNIDCILRMGCFESCNSDNQLTVALLAEQNGVHTVEYYFLAKVITFLISGTIGTQFVIPVNYFNESADAKIKIVQPDGTYYSFVQGSTTYETFIISVKPSPAGVLPLVTPGFPFATEAYVDAKIAALGIPFTHSLVEQVWPFEKWIGGKTIYVRTWDVTGGTFVFTDITTANVIVRHSPIALITTGGTEYQRIYNNGLGGYNVNTSVGAGSKQITVWYTKP